MGKDELLEKLREIVEHPQEYDTADDILKKLKTIVAKKEVGIKLSVKDARERIRREMELFAKSEENKDYKAKQEFVKMLNNHCRTQNVVFKHPETGDPCILLAISDFYGGKFVLENKRTKKRSHTTRDIRTLMAVDVMVLDE